MTGKPVRDQKRVSRKSSKKSSLRQGILAHQPLEIYLSAALDTFELQKAFTMLYASMYTHIYFVYQNYH